MQSPTPSLRESLRGRPFEMGAAFLTAAGKYIFSDWLGHHLLYTTAVIVFWVTYVTVRHHWNRSVIERWGFTRVGLRSGAGRALTVFVVGLGASLFYGQLRGQAIINWNLALLFLLYPIWGTVQQFLLVGLFADNLVALSKGRLPEFVAAIAAGALFAIVHVPIPELIVATFFLGIATTMVFFRSRNLWVVGVLHGWFASVFYFFGMGIDPLAPMLATAFGQ